VFVVMLEWLIIGRGIHGTYMPHALSDGGRAIIAARVILVTGFTHEHPGRQWRAQTIIDLEPAYSAYGYPIVDRSLCWRPGLYVTSALAELEIGPVARNLVGARLAAERLIAGS
jgi:hypothetical protein